MEGITYGKETTGGILFSKRSDPPAGGKAGKGGGSGLGDTEKRLKPLCDPTVQWLPGKRWNAGASEDERISGMCLKNLKLGGLET